eukprot:gene8723-6129_t
MVVISLRFVPPPSSFDLFFWGDLKAFPLHRNRRSVSMTWRGPVHRHAEPKLRIGSIASSRHLLSHVGEGNETQVVNVGEGKTPTFIEELIARLEQHGIRRLLADEDDEENLGVPHAGTPDKGDSSVAQEDQSSRDPYYYCCVCCDIRLTPCCTTTPTMGMLQDIHYHCGTAKHKKSVFWMEDPDSLMTLPKSAEIDPTDHYIRVYVNGIPMLISRNPGGGDMFYPLPHEMDNPLIQREKADETMGHTDGLSIWPPADSDKSFWYYPMQTVSCHAHQHVFLDPRYKARRNTPNDHLLMVQRVPLEEYNRESMLMRNAPPRKIMAFSLKRLRTEQSADLAPASPIIRGARARYRQEVFLEDAEEYPPLENVKSNLELNRFLVSDGDNFRFGWSTAAAPFANGWMRAPTNDQATSHTQSGVRGEGGKGTGQFDRQAFAHTTTTKKKANNNNNKMPLFFLREATISVLDFKLGNSIAILNFRVCTGMELLRCHASLLKTPFEAHGIQLHQMGEPNRTVMPFFRLTPAPIKPVGLRGVRLLAIQHRNENDESLALTNLKELDRSQVPLRFVTKHKRGQLLVWDGSSSEVVGSCSHGRNLVIQQCIMTEDDIFTTVESMPGFDIGESFSVYRWNAITLDYVDSLSLPRKVESMTLAGKCVATATDLSIDIWDYLGIDTRPLSPSLSIKPQELGIATKMESRNNLLFVAGTRRLLSVFSLDKGKLLAHTGDSESYCTSMRVLKCESSGPIVVLTGTSTGYVFVWSFKLKGDEEPILLRSTDKQKLHAANVSDLIADDDIILSISELSGAVVLHRRERIITHLSTTPCRALMLDHDNKRLILGDDLGCISVFSYAAYAVNCQKIECIFSCHAHNGAVTGVYLQLGSGSLWERVVTCSIEGSVATLDFTDDKPLMTFPRQQHWINMTDLVASSPFAVAVAENSTGLIHFLTPNFETHTEYPSLHVGKANIKALRWLNTSTLIVALGSNVVTFYSCVLNDELEPIWRVRQEWMFEQPRGATLPVPTILDVADDGTILLCAGMENHGAKLGILSLIRFDGAKITILYSDTINHSPIHGVVKSLTSSTAQVSYYCILQIENAGITTFLFTPGERFLTENKLTDNLNLMIGDELVTEQFVALEPFASTLQLSYIADGSVHFADVEKNTWTTTRSTRVIPLTAGGETVSSIKSVVGWALVKIASVRAVLLREDSSEVEVIVEGGTVGYVLTYEGDMAPLQETRRRRPYSFPCPPSGDRNGRSPICRAVAAHQEGRYIATAYADGLVQLFDISQERLISRWFTPHTGEQIGLRSFLSCIMVTSLERTNISVYLIPRRFMYDQENDPSRNQHSSGKADASLLQHPVHFTFSSSTKRFVYIIKKRCSACELNRSPRLTPFGAVANLFLFILMSYSPVN